ncbi:universal stress protein [Flavisolibacter nicotianae]|uniref:universal stress protein n=1 Tax=Flavisolibacter nicotianae TaxID=2364882 RepID=UPI000EAD8A2A|nr:universal stress protein [Flavisolibacter nicotianae]
MDTILKSFKTVLVPVDFSVNTEVAIAKTLALVERDTATIHLLHVLKPSPFYAGKAVYRERKRKLEEWRRSIEECAGLTVRCELLQGHSVQRSIRKSAESLRPDAIVIGQTAMHTGLSFARTMMPMALAQATGIPVLTVKPGALHNKTRTVVVPVTDAFPESKLQALEVLCRHGRPNIHLITLVNGKNGPSDFSAAALVHMFQWLKMRLHCPVEYAVVRGRNKAKAFLQYAEKINADVLLVHPEKETWIGWWNRHTSDVLPVGSKVQVLAV